MLDLFPFLRIKGRNSRISSGNKPYREYLINRSTFAHIERWHRGPGPAGGAVSIQGRRRALGSSHWSPDCRAAILCPVADNSYQTQPLDVSPILVTDANSSLLAVRRAKQAWRRGRCFLADSSRPNRWCLTGAKLVSSLSPTALQLISTNNVPSRYLFFSGWGLVNINSVHSKH